MDLRKFIDQGVLDHRYRYIAISPIRATIPFSTSPAGYYRFEKGNPKNRRNNDRSRTPRAHFSLSHLQHRRKDKLPARAVRRLERRFDGMG